MSRTAVIVAMMGGAAAVAIWGNIRAGDAAVIMLVALVASCAAA